jgi:chromosomal replication initiator protein
MSYKTSPYRAPATSPDSVSYSAASRTPRKGYRPPAPADADLDRRRAYLITAELYTSAEDAESIAPESAASELVDRVGAPAALNPNLQNGPLSEDNIQHSTPGARAFTGQPATSPLVLGITEPGEIETDAGLELETAAPSSPASPEEGVRGTAEFDPHVVWQMVLSELALQMPSATYDTWVRDTVVIAYEDGEFIIGMPNAYARDWLENRLRHNIKRTLSSIMRRSVQIQFRVRPRPVQDQARVETAPLYQHHNLANPTPAAQAGPNRQVRQETAKQETASPLQAGNRQSKGMDHRVTDYRVMDTEDDRYSSQLNPNHTFESFVVGNHNRLAHAAALAIVDAPGQTFNPLFIYGGVGLGKTHLLNAIGNSLRQKGYHWLYCSSEQFTNELISAIRNQSTEQFRNKYRQVDVLLIDDIQFIGGKESTQEEFFHTFNHLHAAGRQVVLSSDRPPKALATLEERLRSRFEGGLQTDIAQPDFETRVAILQSKANRMGVTVPYDVLMLVAERVDSNIRELEGALNRLFMQARLLNSPVNLAFARNLMEDLAPQRAPCAPVGVIRIVAEHFSLRPEDLTGRKRTKEVANARQIAMYLLREENDMSLPAIGEQLGGRDHSTVRYGVEQVAKELARDEALRLTIMALRDKVYMPIG